MNVCQICHQNPATIHYTEIEDGAKLEHHLCEECSNAGKDPLEILSQIAKNLGGALNLASKLEDAKKELLEEKQCPECGTTLREILEQGKLGCPSDYDTFAKELNDILLRIHGANMHKGRLPKVNEEALARQKKLRDLDAQMKVAVRDENYEEAARIRDEIKSL